MKRTYSHFFAILFVVLFAGVGSLVLYITHADPVSQKITPASVKPTTEPAHEPPTITIANLKNGQTVSKSVDVAVSPAAQSSSKISKVGFRVDAGPVTYSTKAPYNYTWDTTGLVGEHTLTAWAFDGDGYSTEASVRVITNSPTTTTTLQNISGFSGSAVGAQQVNLTWQPVSSAVTYEVYRKDKSQSVPIAEVPGTAVSFGDVFNLSPKTSYTYTLVARDATGNASPVSEGVTVTTAAKTAKATQ